MIFERAPRTIFKIVIVNLHGSKRLQTPSQTCKFSLKEAMKLRKGTCYEIVQSIYKLLILSGYGDVHHLYLNKSICTLSNKLLYLEVSKLSLFISC